MSDAYIVTGLLRDERTVVLDEAVPVALGRVRVVVEPMPATEGPRSYREVIDSIGERQRLRGHQPPTRDSVDSALRAERESWGE
jgi:hypothetical protein